MDCKIIVRSRKTNENTAFVVFIKILIIRLSESQPRNEKHAFRYLDITFYCMTNLMLFYNHLHKLILLFSNSIPIIPL